MAEIHIGSPQAEFADLGFHETTLTWGRGESALNLRLSLAGDMDAVNPRADFAAQRAEVGGGVPSGLMWSVLKGKSAPWSALAVGGLEPLGDRRWGAWAYASDMTPRQWMFSGWAAWFVLKWAWRRGATIQAVPAPTPQAVRLLKRIGFVGVGEAYMVWEG